MSILMMLALGSKAPAQTFTQVFMANGTWTCPAGVSVADIEGYGARGADASSGTIQRYEVAEYIVLRRRDGGPDLTSPSRLPYYQFGSTPNDYCEPEVSTPSDPTYRSSQKCYVFSNASYSYNNPATTGASATGLGKTMPGSTGNVQPVITSFINVPVTPTTNNPYPINVPSGGRVTIKWRI